MSCEMGIAVNRWVAETHYKDTRFSIDIRLTGETPSILLSITKIYSQIERTVLE